MKNTKNVILEGALNLFNEKGIEYGGMRELAKLLGMRVSNITYYFPTKDYLVMAVSLELRELNNEVSQKHDCNSLRDFLEMQHAIFNNQYKYRCLLLGFVHIFASSPETADNYKETEKKRRRRLKEIFNQLITNGYLSKKTTGAEVKMLVNHIAFIARFWQSEAKVSHYDKTTGEIIYHYFTMMCNILEQHATTRGKKDIGDFLKDIAP